VRSDQQHLEQLAVLILGAAKDGAITAAEPDGVEIGFPASFSKFELGWRGVPTKS